jgi:hypothetical protein
MPETFEDIEQLSKDVLNRGMTDDDIKRFKDFGFDDIDITIIKEDIELEKKMNKMRIKRIPNDEEPPTLAGMLWILGTVRYTSVNSGFTRDASKGMELYGLTDKQYIECHDHLYDAKCNEEGEDGYVHPIPKFYQDFWDKYKDYKINHLRQELKVVHLNSL